VLLRRFTGTGCAPAKLMRWSQVDLDQGGLHVARVKGSKDSTHTLDRAELRDLRKLRQQVAGVYVFETGRGGPLSVDALSGSVRRASVDAVSVRGYASKHHTAFARTRVIV
jgi:integrase